MLSERLPLTIELGISAMFLAVLIGIPAGLLSALRRNSSIDVVTMIGANIGVSIPVFVLGLLLIYIFAVLLRGTPFALPPSGRLSPGISSIPFYEVYGWAVTDETPGYIALRFIANLYIFNSIITADWKVLGDASKHLMLPALALCTIPLSIIARMTRSSLLETLGQDYIRTARAKGLQQSLGHRPPCPAQRVAAGHHHHRPAGRRHSGRGRAHRDDLWPLRRGTQPVRGHHLA